MPSKVITRHLKNNMTEGIVTSVHSSRTFYNGTKRLNYNGPFMKVFDAVGRSLHPCTSYLLHDHGHYDVYLLNISRYLIHSKRWLCVCGCLRNKTSLVKVKGDNGLSTNSGDEWLDWLTYVPAVLQFTYARNEMLAG